MSDEPRDLSAWQSLHPLSVVVNLVPRTWRFLRGAWPLLLALFYGGGPDVGNAVDLLLIGFFFAMTVGSTVVHWATLRWRLEAGRLEITTGLLNRQVRVLDPARIQNTELVRNVFHRLSGLVEVRVETASGGDVEGLLSALDEPTARALVEALESAARGSRAEEAQEESEAPPLLQNDLWDLFRYGATEARFGAAVVIAFGLFMDVLAWLQPGQPQAGLSTSSAVAIGVALVSGTWLAGTLNAIVRMYGFRLMLTRDRLVASAGLLTTRRVELPLDKVQLVTVTEPVLRRAAGFGTLHVETAAARVDAGGTATAEAVVPVVEREGFADAVRAALPTLDLDPWREPLRPPHPKALRLNLLGGALRGAGVAAVLGWAFWPWGLVAVGLLPVETIAAVLDHRHRGWFVTSEMVLSRIGWWHRRTWVLPRAKIQSVVLVQGPLERRWGLGRVTVRVAGSSVSLPAISWEEARALLDLLGRLPAAVAPSIDEEPTARAPRGAP